MPDMDKVIKGLEAHEKGCGHRSHYCDVVECPYRYWDESCNIEEMCHDALALLNKQDELLRKLQKDKDKLCLEVSEWKHRYHDRPLKEQEAVEPKQVDLYGKDEWWGLVCGCPDCKAEWMSDKADTHFCPKCGQAVKWE